MNHLPTFLQIRAAIGLSLEAIAAVAQVPIEDVYYLEAGVRYPQAFADRVLHALSIVAGKHYTRDTVGGIYVVEDEREKHE